MPQIDMVVSIKGTTHFLLMMNKGESEMISLKLSWLVIHAMN
uniref:Uncharacterized protein n=1 Tax=Schistosoma japonicum TaxID=6182 RepID=Q5BZD0_SCHJA|nr:unknown [Schistosoma japonicum]